MLLEDKNIDKTHQNNRGTTALNMANAMGYKEKIHIYKWKNKK